VFHWDPAHPNVVSLYGGMHTGYRRTGLDVVAMVVLSLGRRERKADTATLRLPDVK
jgi:glycerol-3-phosphate dehydrogenase